MLMGGATGLIAAGANVIVSVLTLFAGTIFSTSDTRLVRKIERDAALLKELPDPAKAVMEDLIAYEVQQHSDRRKQRAIRRVNKGAVAALIFIGVVTDPDRRRPSVFGGGPRLGLVGPVRISHRLRADADSSRREPNLLLRRSTPEVRREQRST